METICRPTTSRVEELKKLLKRERRKAENKLVNKREKLVMFTVGLVFYINLNSMRTDKTTKDKGIEV